MTQLNFNENIDNLCEKLIQRIAFLKKIRHHLPLDQQILYYDAMIKEIMYGSSVWVSTSVDNLNKHLNGVCPDYMLELLRRNIDMRATERQSRYGFFN